MSREDSPRRTGRRALATAAGGACGLGLLTVVLAARLVTVATSVDVGALRAGSPTLTTLAPLVEVPLLGVGCVVAAWWSLSLALVTVALLVQAAGLQSAALAACIRAVAPAAVRRLAVAGIGAGLVLTASPALAVEPVPDLGWVSTGTSTPEPTAPSTAPPDAPPPETSDTGTTDGPDDSLATSPTPPVTAPPAVTPPAVVPPGVTEPAQPTPHAPPTSTVTVASGDTLWSITERLMAPGATDTQIAAAWPALYASNMQTIGADPDVILVGQELTVPSAQHSP